MSAVIRITCALALLAALLAPAPAASALDHVAPQGFEADGPWPGIASVTGGSVGCLAPAREANAAAHSGSSVLAASCSGATIAFSAPQEYVTLWAKTDTGGAVTIAGSADATPVRGTGAAGQWIPLTLPVTASPSISQVTVTPESSSSRLFIDDLTFSTTAQPDTAITSSAPPSPTNRTTAAFDFDASIGGSTFSCRLDGADATSCASGKAYDSLADGEHTFSVTATDAFGHADATPATSTWTVDTTPPQARITDGPSGSTTARTASVTFSSADADVSGFECALDDDAFSACTSPKAYKDLALGRHTVRVRASDAAGNVGPTPASLTWTVDKPAAKDTSGGQSTPDPAVDGTPSGASAIEPQCSAAANPGVKDADRNGLLDRCQRLPSAKLPIVAGEQALARVTDGEVWIKLPDQATAAVARAGASGDDGWLPLKGASVIPMQSLVDTRNGTVELDSAATTARRAEIQQAHFRAGIFQIRQARRARARRAARRAAPLDLYLRTPAGAENRCAGAPKDTVVRALSARVTGRYRMWGAVSSARVGGAALWTVSDRCDGTLVAVDRGVVTVHDLRRDATTRVRAGARTLAKAPLFVSLKGAAGR